MKKMLIVFSFVGFVYACNNEASSDKTSGTESATQTQPIMVTHLTILKEVQVSLPM
jgi:hypothetical protein